MKEKNPGKCTYPAQHTPYFTGKLPWTDFQVEYFATVWNTRTQQLQEEKKLIKHLVNIVLTQNKKAFFCLFFLHFNLWRFFPTTDMTELFRIHINSRQIFCNYKRFGCQKGFKYLNEWTQRSKNRAGHATVFAQDDSGRDRETALILHLVWVKSSQYEIFHFPELL